MAMKDIKISDIRENPVALRAVNKDSEDYTGLVDSIKQVGVLNAINVRELRDPETGQKYYSLVDGLHRYNAAMDAGLETIPAQILSIDEGKVLEAQLMANVHKVETRPVEYSKQLSRILAQDPTLTANALAAKLAKSPTWISQRLGLAKLEPNVAKLVDAGEINLTNAFVMAKLPAEEQPNWVDRAITMPPAEFSVNAQSRIKEIRDAKREGRTPGSQEFVPVPHLRKLTELKVESETPEMGVLLIRDLGLKKPEEIWAAALKWALHLDPRSIEVARAKDEQRKKEAEEAKVRRKAERDAQAAKKAAEAQAAITS